MTFPYQIIDLTHTLDEMIPSWTGGCGFHQEVKLDYKEGELSFRVQQLKMHAGIGTHIDAPAHCIPGGLTVDQLSLQALSAPCVMIDLSHVAHERYSVSVQDVQAFEEIHGLIQPHSFVLIRTGWERFWGQKERYHNKHLFPSVSEDAALLFLKRDIVGLGIDTLSPDRPEDGYPVHKALLGARKYIVENVANAVKLPPIGSFTLALPLKTKGGTEAPMRLVALLKES